MADVIERVQKLLALAKDSANEHEAAQAASRAAILIQKHQLDEAVLRVESTDKKAEPIVKDRVDPSLSMDKRKRVAWKETIAFAIARDLGVKVWFHNHFDVRGMGRQSSIQAWQYTVKYLEKTINELADQNWLCLSFHDQAATSIKGWKNAFRNGCAQRIATRIWQAREERLKRNVVDNENGVTEIPEVVADAIEAVKVAASDVNSLALAIVAKDQEEVDEAYESFSKTFGKASYSIGVVSSNDGYQAGRRAGDKVKLGGKHKGLKAGQGSLDE